MRDYLYIPIFMILTCTVSVGLTEARWERIFTEKVDLTSIPVSGEEKIRAEVDLTFTDGELSKVVVVAGTVRSF